jgi:hypothetical protein
LRWNRWGRSSKMRLNFKKSQIKQSGCAFRAVDNL